MRNALNPLNELSDIYLGSIIEEDNSPEAIKARVMQHVRAIRYRARKEGENLNKAYNEFMGSQSGISSTEKQMVKERLGLTGGSAHVGEEVEHVDEKISASGYARAKKWREDQAREKDRKEQEYFAKKAKTHKWDGEKWNKREKVSEENVEEGLKQARKNIGMDPDKPSCWDGYKAKGTKKFITLS